MIAKLAENNPEWDEIAKGEAQDNPKIEQARKRIEYGDIKGIAEGKWSNADRVIAGHYFKSPILEKPLRELSADEASDGASQVRGGDQSPAIRARVEAPPSGGLREFQGISQKVQKSGERSHADRFGRKAQDYPKIEQARNASNTATSKGSKRANG